MNPTGINARLGTVVVGFMDRSRTGPDTGHRPGLAVLLLVAILAPAAAAGHSLEMDEADPWPASFAVPESVTRLYDEDRRQHLPRRGSTVRLWVPPAVERVRALLLLPDHTDLPVFGCHPALRRIASERAMAIMVLTGLPGPPRPSATTAAGLAQILAAGEASAGVGGLRRAPWVVAGKSSSGRFPIDFAWSFPERTVATIAYHAEVPPWPMAAWSRVGSDSSILHCSVNGFTEWEGTWYRHVRPSLLNYQLAHGWLAHQLVVYGVDHGYYADYYLYPNHGRHMEKRHRLVRCTDVWDYLALFIDRALDLRLDPADDGSGPLQLRPVDRTRGWSIHPRSPEELLATKWFPLRRAGDHGYRTVPWPEEPSPVFAPEQGTIATDALLLPASEVPADERRHRFWLADETLARAWLRLHDIHRRGRSIFNRQR